MNVETYLKQGRYLDQRIKYKLKKMTELRETMYSISAPTLKEDKVQSSPSGEAPFVKILEQITTMEEQVQQEIDLLVSLKAQIGEAILQVEDNQYQQLLTYRYVENMSWDQICDLMNIGRTTAWRWRQNALDQISLPESPILMKSA